jgi:hypothetical protein
MSTQDEQLEKGGFGAVSGAEEVTQGSHNNANNGGSKSGGKGSKETDKALAKGGFGAVTGAEEEVKAKL